MNKTIYTINEIKDIIRPIALQYGVDALYLFGSYAKGSANPDSDIDFRIDKGAVRGIKFAGLYTDLEETLGKSIDLVTTASLDDNFRERIAEEEILVYAR